MGLPLVQQVVGRLTADKKPDRERDMLVLAALDGTGALSGYLDGNQARPRPAAAAAEQAPTREPLGAYLKSIKVVGPNGSGKSSFADALELLLTGDTYRWSHRARVWKQGWRNLHHKPVAIEAEFFVEGDKRTSVASRWKDDAELEAAETFAQSHGKPRMAVADLGLEAGAPDLPADPFLQRARSRPRRADRGAGEPGRRPQDPRQGVRPRPTVHAAVEDLLTGLSGAKPLAALALFDDEKRACDVMPRLN